MNRRKAAAVISAAPLAAGAQSSIRDRFVGVWKLISCESKEKAGGKIGYPYSETPVGRLTYDAGGRMSAQLMHPDRHGVGGDPSRGSALAIRDSSCEDLRRMLSGFSAYMGTFDIDETSRTVIHHVKASLIPNWVGTDLRRAYEFSGRSQLTLTAEYPHTVLRLLWQRED